MSKCKLIVFSDIHYLIGSLVENINMDGVPDGVYFEVELENRNIQIAERHIKL